MSLTGTIVKKVASLEKEREGSRRVEIQRRDQHAWSHACSTFLSLPMLRGFWPMSSVNESGNAYDLSGQGRTLTYNGTPLYDYDSLAPYIDLRAAGDFLNRADEAGLDILGTETYVANPGLTFGGWFWRDVQASQDLICKGGAAATQAYTLYNTGANDNIRIEIHDGVGVQGHTFAGGSEGTGHWELIAGRFIPSTSLTVFVNNTSDGVAVASASIRNTAGSLIIGSGPAVSDLDGRASMCFLCAAALSDDIITALYAQTRALFGV